MKTLFPQSRQAGHTLVELMVALFVGSIVIAATYAGYRVFSTYIDKLTVLAEADRVGVRSLEMIKRDLRMAGYKDFSTLYGPIGNPLTVIPGSHCCGGSVVSRCDRLVLTYDLSANQRVQVSYALQRIVTSRGTRCRLNRSQQYWSGSGWQGGYVDQPVADWVEGLELTPDSIKASGTYVGYPQGVDTLLRVRGSRLTGNALTPVAKIYQTRIQVRNVALVP